MQNKKCGKSVKTAKISEIGAQNGQNVRKSCAKRKKNCDMLLTSMHKRFIILIQSILRVPVRAYN